MGHELRLIVHPQVYGRWIQLEQLLDRFDHIHSMAATAHPNRHADTAEFIDHVQELMRAAIHRQVELEVDRPPVVWVFGPQELPGSICGSCTLPLARQGPLQSLLPPELLHPLVVDAPAIQPQPPVDQPAAPAHMAPGHLPDSPPQLLLLDIHHRQWPALGVAVLARQPAGTTLGKPESILQNHNGSTASFRA